MDAMEQGTLIFRYNVHAMGGDRRIVIWEQHGEIRYRAHLDGREVSGTLAADELTSFTRDLDAMDIWTLTERGMEETVQPTCQPWRTLEVSIPPRYHLVRYYGAPSPRHKAVNARLDNEGVTGRMFESLGGLGFEMPAVGELMCPACSRQGYQYTDGTQCPRHGTTLIRVDGYERCATCEWDLTPDATECPMCKSKIAR